MEILTLTSFIVSQPVLEVFGNSPETFAYRGAGRLEIVLFAISVTLVPSLALWGLTAAAGTTGGRARRAAQSVVTGLLFSLLVIQLVKRFTPLVGLGLAVTGGTIGVILTIGIIRWEAVRRWLPYGWPLSLVVILIFLLLSPVSSLILPQRVGRAAADRSSAPVVMAVFDQLPLASLIDPEGQINETLYPNFARLAERSTWYRNYTVTEHLTQYSIPTMLTGQLARDRSKKLVAADYPDNLFSLLQRTHDQYAFSVVGSLCSARLCTNSVPNTPVIEGGFSDLIQDAIGIWSDISLPGIVTRDITAQFEEPVARADLRAEPTSEEQVAHWRSHREPLHYTQFLQSLHRGPRPSLHFVHLALPHYPWRFFPSGLEYYGSEAATKLPNETGSTPRRWLRKPGLLDLTRQRHILQVQYVDRLVGGLIERLQETGLYDEALVVVTSDHGHSFGPGRPRQAPTHENLHEVMWVPLIIKAPYEDRGRIEDANIMATDLLPTIADLLGIEIPWPTDGRSALYSAADRGPVKTFIRHQNLRMRVPWPTGPIEMSVSEALGRLRQEAFAPAAESSDTKLLPYLVGPHAELIGKPVSDLPLGDAVAMEVRLDAAGEFEAVDLSSGIVPAIISGVASAPEGTTIAVVLNGRVAGISATVASPGEAPRFRVVAPEFFFRSGKNSLQLLIVEDGVIRPVRPR